MKKCNGIWNQDSNSIKKELGFEPIFNEFFLKIKIRSCSDDATDANDKKKKKNSVNIYNINWFCF